MKLFTKCIIAILVLYTIRSNAQNSQTEDHSLLIVNELSSHQNDIDYKPLSFNYHEYEEVNLEDFGKSFHIDDVKKYTLFAVFSHSGTRDLFQVHSDNKVVKISDDLVQGKQKIGIDVDEDFSHMLLYSGSSGKKSKDEISSGMRIGRADQVRGSGIINLAEVLVFDKILTKKEIKKKQTHLAIKYGISLPMDTSYLDGNSDIVYDPNLHKEFNNRVIALANNESLNVSQTTHHRNHLLEIGLSEINPIQKKNLSSLESDSYIFIGDNGGDIKFQNDYLGRIWEFSSSNPQNHRNPFCFKFFIEDIEILDPSFDYFISFSEDEDFEGEIEKSIKLNKIGEHLVINGISLLDSERQYISITRQPKKSLSEYIVSLEVNNLQIEGQDIEAQLSSSHVELQGHLYLYNLDGYIIDRTKVDASFTFQKRYSFTHPGIYFLSYVSGETQIVKKVVIQ